MAKRAQVDLLSLLPDELLIAILSLLPTRHAARTSLLSRRFRNLWKACRAIHLDLGGYPFKESYYVSMANSALLSREPSNHLDRLCLRLTGGLPPGLAPFVPSLLARAHSLRLRHLTIDGYLEFEPDLRAVFSISSLESLSIKILPRINLPSAATLTRLKSLSINMHSDNSAQVQRVVSELCFLQHLQLRIGQDADVRLSSLTIKKLDLIRTISGLESEPNSVGLFLPSLEFFYLNNWLGNYDLPHIHGNIPLLKNSVIEVHSLLPEDATLGAQLLNCISHVEELSLYLMEDLVTHYPFHNLLGLKEAPVFPNLKHLDVSMCFHELNCEAVVSLLRQSPALQSLKLVHMVHNFSF